MSDFTCGYRRFELHQHRNNTKSATNSPASTRTSTTMPPPTPRGVIRLSRTRIVRARATTTTVVTPSTRRDQPAYPFGRRPGRRQGRVVVGRGRRPTTPPAARIVLEELAASSPVVGAVTAGGAARPVRTDVRALVAAAGRVAC